VSAVAFLVAAVVLSVVGCAILLLRHRRPTSLEHGVDAFATRMRALAPERRPVDRGGRPDRSPSASARPTAEGR
jgi:hypothetical protein